MLYALLGVEVQEPDNLVEEEPKSPVSASLVHYVDLETENAIDEVCHDDEDVPQRSDDPVECAFQNLRLANQTADFDEEIIDGLGEKPDRTYVHVVKRILPEEAIIAVRAALTLPKVPDVYRRMGIEPVMPSDPLESVRASLVDLVELCKKDSNSGDYDIALEATAVLGLLFWATRKLELYKREGASRQSRSDDEHAGRKTKKQSSC